MKRLLTPLKARLNQVRRALTHEPNDKEALLAILHSAQQRELINVDTFAMVEGALQMSDMHACDVMVPRAQMVVLEIDEAPEKMIKKIIESGHSRFPVVDDHRDNVQGIFIAKDLLDYYANEHRSEFNMRDVMRPAVFIPESKRLNVLLREFRTSRNHMAIVVDEYSGVAGLITIEDVIEQVIGEIDDEHDVDDQIYITPRTKGFHMVWALTPLEEFNSYFKTKFSSEEFDTIGGLLLKAFGHLPKRGEHIEIEEFFFEVVRSSGRRIQLIRVKRLTEDSIPNS